ncbi:MAG: DUF507 family protein [Bryobacterales bacterium]|nr:DUF507 family protein [Bryobacterales bacterium]
MLLAPEFINYLSRQLIRKLHPVWLECGNLEGAAVQVAHLIDEDLRAEDDLNEDVRDILEQYEDVMRRDGVSYMEMFKKIKRKLILERKIVTASGRDSGDHMRLSRDKILDLSHKVIVELKRSRDVRVRRDPNDVRLEIVKQITEILQLEDRVETAARDKIRSMKRVIQEGTEEWDILHRRYYAEELKRYGIDMVK